MNVLSAINVTAGALNAEKMRLDLVSQNIANANTTRGIDGKPYARQIVSFQSVMEPSAFPGAQGVTVGEVASDERPGDVVYNPQHPHADKDGMVHMPNVNVAHEMVDLISATRAYEANLAVVRNAKQMAAQALSIGR